LKGKHNRSSVVSVRLLPEEKQQLTKRAAEQHISLSQLLRLTALKQIEKTRIKFVPEVNRRLYFQLGKILEQLQTIETDSDFLNDLQELLNEVRRELIDIHKSPKHQQHDN
jgi:hypothetical protein